MDACAGTARAGSAAADEVARSANAAQVRTARALLPVLQENQVEMRAFALQIAGRLTELQAARGLGWVRDRVAVI